MIRKLTVLLRFVATLALACSLLVLRAEAEIRYTVSLAHPEQHLFHVTVEVPDVKDHIDLQMAAWDALYEIRDFSSHVQRVTAVANGREAAIEKLDKLTWRVRASGTIKVSYDTFWDDPGPFSSQLNAEHAFINPAMILLYVPDRRPEDCEITFGSVPADWKMATSLKLASAETTQIVSLRVTASDFAALADSPIELSHFEEFTLHDLSPPVHVVIHGDDYKRRDVESVLRKICAYEVKLMDGAPYSDYTFIFHIGKASGGTGGGMEHANSTAINIPNGASLPNVSAHEFFHLWNVKRIRPASLEPIDRTREMYTRSLWFAEGVTNTVSSYALVRTGIWSKQEFLQDLSQQITELESRPAEQWQSAEQSSLDAWLEKYALYNQPQRSVSYYTKGQVLGFLLDIVLRDRTDNQRSLDDLLRAMNMDFAREGKFYRDSLDIRFESEKLADLSLADFFDNYVAGANPLPYEKVLALAGLELRAHESVRATLGFLAQREPGEPWSVAAVEADSPAAKSGLQVGDEILRWNNGEVPRRAERWAAQQKPGDILRLRIRRAEKEETLEVHLGELHQKFFQVAEMSGADDRARRLRDGLLHGTTDPITARSH
ncbi:MAG TPA: PDZ domain-containing protein [Candidatus Baltobacteraceae bacterium]|nr:PDZ domain-containing protein [Candidatus Baltobacteraceae bacterium]